ncbi:kelch repeat F-box protein [Rhynchospora pubera]|uniref:Kelch repeat F-box protein n=1 Tax=Rhynchospora pubera TaxID=906938 RepID=A0AAV8C7N5_9POAL|nr:kelch repeat F-box protein [Rhynchospora pubera]
MKSQSKSSLVSRARTTRLSATCRGPGGRSSSNASYSPFDPPYTAPSRRSASTSTLPQKPTALSGWFSTGATSTPTPTSLLLSSQPLPTGFLSSACAAAGPFVFLLGGSLPGVPSNVVQILDLRLGGKWFLGPRLSIAREFAAVSYLNGRLYVMGGCSPSSEAWAESLNLFDRNPQWVPIDSPRFLRNKWMHGCLVLSGQIVAMAGQFVFGYDPGQNTGSCPAWVPAPEELDLGSRRWAVVVNNIVYSYDYTGKIVGYDTGMDNWSTVLGVDKNIPKCKSGVTLANLNGILCVIWREQIFGSKRKEMVVDWVGIEVTNLGSKGLHGSILWQETVSLDLPCGSSIAHCVVAEF